LLAVIATASPVAVLATSAEAGCTRQCVYFPGGRRCRICCTREPSYAVPPPPGIVFRGAPHGFDPGVRSYRYSPPAYDYAAERRRHEDARQEQRRQEAEQRRAQWEAEQAQRRAQRAVEAQRIAQYHAQQRALAAQLQAERDAQWQRWKADTMESVARVLAALGAFALWVGLPFTVLVFLLWWASTLWHRYRLYLVHRDIERTRASTRRFEDVAADLKRAKDEADAFIEQEARMAYQRGRGL
jgi:hypothetical protein